jgi:hypothetical protein
MIHEVIHYLVDLPTPTTGPLYTACNTPAMKTALGGSTVVAGVYSSNNHSAPTVNPATNTALPTPYVRVYDTGRKPEQIPSLGGSGHRTLKQVMLIDCVANGATDYEANRRAFFLMLAVDAKLRQVLNSGALSGLTVSDLGGTASQVSVTNSWIELEDDPMVQGPGSDNSDAKCLAIKKIRVTMLLAYQLTS